MTAMMPVSQTFMTAWALVMERLKWMIAVYVMAAMPIRIVQVTVLDHLL